MRKVINTSMHSFIDEEGIRVLYIIATCEDGTMWLSFQDANKLPEWEQLPAIPYEQENFKAA